tara:strand:- start:6539 stop:7849 length:1311 start_codon:yes stop_codon:yes gene_type:complete
MNNPRLIAIQNLITVIEGNTLDKAFKKNIINLPKKDIALAKELSFGLCRWYFQLDSIIKKKLKKPLKQKDMDIRLVLMLGAYQLLYSRVAEHAAISTSVELTRDLNKEWASKVVNAILRDIQRDKKKLGLKFFSKINENLQTRYSQQRWLIEEIQHNWPKEFETILESFQKKAPMTIRVNTKRQKIDKYIEDLRKKKISFRTIDDLQSALVLEKPIGVNELPGFSEGIVSIQDGGAQYAADLIDLEENQIILDACSAPGGKLGHILEMEKNSSVIAMDISSARLRLVKENLDRLKYECQVYKGDASKPPIEWQSGIFDRILLDVPCSSSGVIRRHPDIRMIRKYEDLDNLLKQQINILSAIWPCLKQGGKLLYSTCSILPQENEMQIQNFLDNFSDANEILISKKIGIQRIHGIQILPGNRTMDGFYYALLEKKLV